jgi:putative ABC transport system permease protein
MAKLLNLLPWRRRRLERELDRELRYHMERRIDDLRRSGATVADARRQAALEFGGLAQVREDVRETWAWRWLDTVGRDVRYAFRTLLRNPGFAVTALLSLAVGTGVNAAIFSIVDQVALQPLPVHDPDRLVQLAWRGDSLATHWGAGYLLSYPLCRDLQEQRELFDGIFCRHATTANFAPGEQRESVRAEIVSGSYFSVLRVRPALGRLIDTSDDLQPGAHPVMVLSYQYWTNRLGGTPDVIGRKFLVNNYPMTVIGIAPAAFPGVDPHARPMVWIPAAMAEQAANIDAYWDRLLDRRAAWLNVLGRLKPGVTPEQVKAGLGAWFTSMLEADTRREGFPRVTAEQRRSFLASTLDVFPAPRGLSNLRRALERPLWVLTGGTLFLLLLASLNVAGLLLARGAARTRELTTRMAIGATRGRITSQVLVESLLLTLGGGALGLAAAPAVSRALLAYFSMDGDVSVHIDARVFAFAFLTSAVTAALCAIAPALQAGRIPLIASLKERSTLANGGVRLRKALVIGQLAFTLVLLIGAGLFVQTLAHLYDEVAFPSSRTLMLSVNPPASGYSPSDAEQAMREVLRRLREAPTIERVAIANTRILSGGGASTNLTIQSVNRIVTDRAVTRMRVGPGFFATLGTQVVAGRDFDERDVRPPGAAPTAYRSAIVNESFARRYFKDRSPVGYRLGLGSRPDAVTNIEIIGVVRDINFRNLRDGETEKVYFHFWDRDSGDGTFYLKLRGSGDSAFAPIRAAVAQVDPALPVVLTMLDEQIEQSLRNERMLASLSTGFALMALLLSAVGLYGVMSFVVTQRTQEIGVRLALGATRPAVVWLVIRDALIMVGTGTAIALPSAWALRRLVEAELFGVRPFDVPTVALAMAVLATVALGGAMLPAWRAASLSPTDALRLE